MTIMAAKPTHRGGDLLEHIVPGSLSRIGDMVDAATTEPGAGSEARIRAVMI